MIDSLTTPWVLYKLVYDCIRLASWYSSVPHIMPAVWPQ